MRPYRGGSLQSLLQSTLHHERHENEGFHHRLIIYSKADFDPTNALHLFLNPQIPFHTLTFPLTKLATSSLFSNTDREWSRLWTSQSQCLFTSSTAAPDTQEDKFNGRDPSNESVEGTEKHKRKEETWWFSSLTAGDYPARLGAGNLEEDAEGRDPGVGVQHGVQRPHQETCRDDKTENHANNIPESEVRRQ